MGLVVVTVWSSGAEPSHFAATNWCMLGAFSRVLLVAPPAPPGRRCLTSVSSPLVRVCSVAAVLLVPYPGHLLPLPLRCYPRPPPPIGARSRAGAVPEGGSAGVRVVPGRGLPGAGLRPAGLQRQRRPVNVVHHLHVSEGRRLVQAAGARLRRGARVGPGLVEVLRRVAPVGRLVSFAVSQLLRLVLLLANTNPAEVMRGAFIRSFSASIVGLSTSCCCCCSTVGGGRVS